MPRFVRSVSFRAVVVAAVLLVSSRVSAETPPTLLWGVNFDAGDNSQAFAIGRGPDGQPVVAGVSCAIGTNDCALRAIRYDATDGSTLWNVTFQSSAGSDGGFAVAVGADNHPIVAGSSCDGNSGTCTTRLIKFDGATGNIMWNATDSTGHGSNGAYGVAIGTDGHPITACPVHAWKP